jgi:hypothetical protein
MLVLVLVQEEIVWLEVEELHPFESGHKRGLAFYQIIALGNLPMV